MERRIESTRTIRDIDFDAERLADVNRQIQTVEDEGRTRALIRDGAREQTSKERFDIETAPTVLEDHKNAEVLRADLKQELSSGEKSHPERSMDPRFHSPKEIATLKAQEGIFTAWQNIKNAPRDAWRMLFGKKPTITKSEAPLRAEAPVSDAAPLKAEVFIDRESDRAQMMSQEEARLRIEATRLHGIADQYKQRGDAAGESEYRVRAEDADRLANIEKMRLRGEEKLKKAA